MAGLPPQLIASLLANKGRRKNNSKSYAVTRQGRVPLTKAVTEQVGAFQGKAGTFRRSRKGQPRRQANGRRFYVRGDNSEILAYKVTP